VTSYHQILVGVGPGDAITQMALELRNALGAYGDSEIFAQFIDRGVDGVRPLRDLPVGRRSDVVIYHSSFGHPDVTRCLAARAERMVLAYHNITPSRFFVDHDPAFAAGLEWGRHELTLLTEHVEVPVAMSAFSALELEALGYRNVHVVPAGVRPGRLLDQALSSTTIAELGRRAGPSFVLGVSQLLPHKRQEVLIQAAHVLQTIHGLDIGLVLAGSPRAGAYSSALAALVRRLRVRNVWLTGRVSDAELATMYRSARVFASASAHEGLGITPLEAMAFGFE
jgi:glycosyltransferase involved in cell wall biosynthesis